MPTRRAVCPQLQLSTLALRCCVRWLPGWWTLIGRPSARAPGLGWGDPRSPAETLAGKNARNPRELCRLRSQCVPIRLWSRALRHPLEFLQPDEPVLEDLAVHVV